MDTRLRCLTFSVEDMVRIKEIVHEYKKQPFEALPSPFLNLIDVPYRLILKAKNRNFPKEIINPDCELTFVHHEGNTFDIHYSTPNSVLLNVEGMIEPFDFSVKIKHNSTRYEFTKRPNGRAMNFLKSTYKFGVQQQTIDVFILGCQIALFATGVLHCMFKRTEMADRVNFALLPDYYKVGMDYIAYQQKQSRKNNITEGWDVVNLTTNQYTKVVETNSQLGVEYDNTNIPLPRFCLSLFNGKDTHYYFFEKNGKYVRCGVTDTKSFDTQWFSVVVNSVNENGVHVTLDTSNCGNSLCEWLNTIPEGAEEENWGWCANAFFVVNTFMLHYGDVTMDVETKQAKARSEHVGKKHKHTNTVRLFKSYKLIKSWKSKARKKTEITCSAWGVRGHFRHYKSGKVVFIEPFVKGKERANYVGKEYSLLPYADA